MGGGWPVRVGNPLSCRIATRVEARPGAQPSLFLAADATEMGRAGVAGWWLIGPKAKVQRGSNACRGELRRRAELHGLLVAFLRVGRSELSAVIDDIALVAHTALLHSTLVSSSAQPGFLRIDHNLLNSNLPSIPRSLVHTSSPHLVNITIVNHNFSPWF